jgi:predicted metal-dependent enzyme (double-stranded beta helix superfamily)
MPGAHDARMHITRRHLVTATTATALTGFFAPQLLAAPSSKWEEFLAEARERGRKLLEQDGVPVDEYLWLIASLASRIDAVAPTQMQEVPWTKPPVSFGLASKGAPFVVIEWQLAPGAVLPPHNHPNASVCTIGLDGEAIVENYELAGAVPAYESKELFRVRRTHQETIAARRVNTVAPERDNIHTFKAGPKGARGIDITSMHGAMAPFSYLKIEEAVNETTFAARWWKPVTSSS